MSTVLEAIERARATGDFSGLVAAIPYSSFVGIEVQMQDEVLLGKLAYRDSNIGNAGLPALHGGVIGALLESTAIFEVVWRMPSRGLPKTINLTIDYLRSGRPVDTYARARIIREGKRVASVRVEAWQGDPQHPIAAADLHILLTAPEGE